MEKRDWIIYSIAIIFSLTMVLVIINFLQGNTYYGFLWGCYITIPIIIFGLFKKDSNIILSQVIILAIPDLLWIIDFFYLLITGHVLIGVTTFPTQGSTLINKMRLLQHLYIVPLSLLALSRIGLKKSYRALLIGLIEIVIIFLLTILIVPDSININCVYDYSCTIIPITFLPHTIEWFIFAFGFVIISYFAIISLPFIKKRN